LDHQNHRLSDALVAEAPKFCEIARKVVELTEGCVLVAHNLPFDYSFLRKEFAELGYTYKRQSLCTVRLSRRLLPGLSSYSLGPLCNHLGIEIHDRHRALGDALATAKVLQKLLQVDASAIAKPAAMLKKELDNEIGLGLLPPLLKESQVTSLPEATGVYFFHNERGNTLYVGKSNNIRKRVLSHLNGGHRSGKSASFKSSIADISFEITGSELLAELREAEEIQRLQPEFNRALRQRHYPYGLFYERDEAGFINLVIRHNCPDAPPLLNIRGRQGAETLAENLIEKYQLCRRHFMLPGGTQLPLAAANGCKVGTAPHQCANRQHQMAALYNLNVQRLIQHYSLPAENFLVFDVGRSTDEKTVILIQQHQIAGYAFISIDQLAEFSNSAFSHAALSELTTPIVPMPEGRHILLRSLRRLKWLSLDLPLNKNKSPRRAA
jgi:DNA polymerase-3 subunit epsilon